MRPLIRAVSGNMTKAKQHKTVRSTRTLHPAKNQAPGNGKLFIAQTDTRSFDWMGVGRTKQEATNALLQCWYAHCRQYARQDGIELDLHYIQADDIAVREVEIGKGYRDGQEVPS